MYPAPPAPLVLALPAAVAPPPPVPRFALSEVAPPKALAGAEGTSARNVPEPPVGYGEAACPAPPPDAPFCPGAFLPPPPPPPGATNEPKIDCSPLVPEFPTSTSFGIDPLCAPDPPLPMRTSIWDAGVVEYELL